MNQVTYNAAESAAKTIWEVVAEVRADVNDIKKRQRESEHQMGPQKKKRKIDKRSLTKLMKEHKRRIRQKLKAIAKERDGDSSSDLPSLDMITLQHTDSDDIEEMSRFIQEKESARYILTQEEISAIIEQIIKEQRKYVKDKAARKSHASHISKYSSRSRELTMFRTAALQAGVADGLPPSEIHKLKQLFSPGCSQKAVACLLLEPHEFLEHKSTATFLRIPPTKKYVMLCPPWWSDECFFLVKKFDKLIAERYPEMKVGQHSMPGGSLPPFCFESAPLDVIGDFQRGRQAMVKKVPWAFIPVSSRKVHGMSTGQSTSDDASQNISQAASEDDGE